MIQAIPPRAFAVHDRTEVILYSETMEVKHTIQPAIGVDGPDVILAFNEVYVLKDGKYIESSYYMYYPGL